MKVFRKLGFTHLETAEIVFALNKLLANYHVHYQKLRKFHWEVVGPDFFDLHNIFEEEYNNVQKNIDDVAERIRVFGKQPMSNLSDYLDQSEIKEVQGNRTGTEMVKEVLDDFEVLLSYMLEVSEAANAIGDTSTSHIIAEIIQKMEKRHWMLTAFLKDEKDISLETVSKEDIKEY